MEYSKLLALGLRKLGEGSAKWCPKFLVCAYVMNNVYPIGRLAYGRSVIAALLLLLLVVSSSCITPPPLVEPSVIPRRELALVSRIKKGKDLAASGRSDLAEREFRLALSERPDLAYLYNDLGFVLFAQDRATEAEAMFRKALELEPRNILARGNLSQVLYADGRFEDALHELESIVDTLNIYTDAQLSDALGVQIGRERLFSVYRSMSMVYYSLGQLDDALCYSWLAQLAAGSVVQAGQHSRLLLSLESGANARAILQGAVTARKGNVPPPMLLDYSMTLYVTGDKGLSRTALARVLQSPVIDPGVRRTARLLRLIIALENNNEDEAKEVYFNLQDDDPKLCLKEERAKVIDPEHYWPMAITDAVQNLVVKLCDYEEQPLFES